MGKKELSVKGQMDYDSVVTFLEDFVKSFKERKVVINRGECDFVTLTPADVMDLEVEGKIKKGAQKLSIEMSWREEAPVMDEVGFSVSSEEPEIIEPAPVVEEKPEVKPESKPEVKPEVSQNKAPATAAPAGPAKPAAKPEAKADEKTAAKPAPAKTDAKPAPAKK